jgi:hypothetical protein
MPKATLVYHDPAVLTCVSELERLFIKYGNLNQTTAKQKAGDVRNRMQVSIDVEDTDKAHALVKELQGISIKAIIAGDEQ